MSNKIIAVYERYKHLDRIMSETHVDDDTRFDTLILRDLWAAIRDYVTQEEHE